MQSHLIHLRRNAHLFNESRLSKNFSHCSTSLLLVLLSHFFHPFMDEKVDFAKSGVCNPGTWAPGYPGALPLCQLGRGTGEYFSLKNSGFSGDIFFQNFGNK